MERSDEQRAIAEMVRRFVDERILPEVAELERAEAGSFCVEEALRIHGGYGYTTEYEIERLYRDAPLLLIGKALVERHRIAG